jgi:hypothetical protein
MENSPKITLDANELDKILKEFMEAQDIQRRLSKGESIEQIREQKKDGGDVIGTASLVEEKNPRQQLIIKMLKASQRSKLQGGGKIKTIDLDTEIGQLEYLANLSPTNSYEAYVIEAARDELAELKRKLNK